MIFTADSSMSYRSGDYRIIWNTMGWSVWNYARQKACIVRDVRLPVAMEACEADAEAKGLDAVFVK